MLPSVISRQIQEGVRSFLGQMFPVTTPYFQGMMEGMRKGACDYFRGPWYELHLPFETEDADGGLPFKKVSFPHAPHRHQAQAFRRLAGEERLSTLVATGTGSGKTECFLYPLLDYCATHREPGIKAVVIYPMNALANDQAKRFARAVHEARQADASFPDLRVGLYLGHGLHEGGAGSHTMGRDHVIDDRYSLQKNPPDILLTNYKMLDYLLLRKRDSGLWAQNTPGTLAYVVVDELHTFDGAQATDLACLLRRLKYRLGMKPGRLCCVGTSATLGDGDEASRSRLTGYARTVFGEPGAFTDAGCIVRESALTPEAFLKGRESAYFRVPSAGDLGELPMRQDETPAQWLDRQFALWFGDAPLPADMHDPAGSAELGEMLLQHRFLTELLGVYQQGGALPMEEAALQRGLERVSPDLAGGELFRHVLDSFLSLCAVALYTHPRTGRVLRSFLRMHVHLWMRELSNMRGQVLPWAKRKDARLVFAADAKQGDPLALPLVHCRNCGSLAWGALAGFGQKGYSSDGSSFAQEFISGSTQQVRLLLPVEPGHAPQEGNFHYAFCAKCSRMTLFSGEEPPKCHHCHSDEAMVEVRELTVEGRGDRKVCPCCGAKDSMALLGSRAAGLNSTAISILLASPANTEPKMLAFSDNVQDASHRAGFFNSRTYSHLLRTELCRRLAALKLPDLAALWEDTLHREDPARSPEEFVAAFMPQDKTWLEDWRHFAEKGELPKPAGREGLCSLVRRRLAWEFYTELTWRSRYGRSLERTGTYMLSISPERIAAAAEVIAAYAAEKLGSSYRLGVPDIARWVIGVLRYLRTNGAVMLPLLQSYAVQGRTFAYDNKYTRTWMPAQSDYTRPRFLAVATGDDFLPCYSTSGGRPSWLEDWTMRIFDGRLSHKLQAEPFISTALERLVANGLLTHPAPDGKEARDRWGIPPAELEVEGEVAALRCGCCGMRIAIGSRLQAMAAGMPCLKTGCPGRLRPCEPNTDGQALYTMGRERRLRAVDHSSLLEKREREELEKRFIAQDTPMAPNMLSCTPTLEMGVDIGDLESVLLCSVPPRTANYRQRIGRAGRARGNAFSLTTSNNKSGNLYFYHAPQNMIAGSVDVPGVYLKATSILERQLFAFYLDNWVQLGNDLPRKVRELLSNLENPAAFPQLFYDYAERNGDRLYVEFLALFDNDFPELADFKYVRKSIREKADYMCERLATHFLSLRAERDGYAAKRDDCRNVRQRLKKLDAERGLSDAEAEELEEVIRQYTALRYVIANLESRDTLEFLTDEGLLPNYAFPESGVTLDSILIKSKGDGKKRETTSETYTRAGAAAITELAVGNYFYVKGMKLRVNQVDLSPQGDNEPAVQEWRFCPNCHYIARRHLQEGDGRCPKCHAVWSDKSQVRPMVRMKRVVATGTLEKALSLDREDERNSFTYQKYMVPEVLGTEPGKTWLMESPRSVFAYQYVGLVQFREMNLGRYDSNAPKLRTDSKELQVPGFRICSGCGKLLPATDSVKDHDWGCPNRRKAGGAPAIDGLLLYRELKSEALRISLPTSSRPGEDVRESFMSALMLGLRQHFQGDIAHLHFCDDHLRIRGEAGATAADLDCLMVYDSVPGGTGYLKQLGVDGDSLLAVLRKALDTLQACPCATADDADGCHLCVLAHRTRPNATPSRRLAIELLSGILEGGAGPKEIKSMEDIPVNPLLGSELERKFLTRLCQDERFRVEPFFRNKPCYSISYVTEDSGPATTLWILEPQGAVDGLPAGVKTVPDFVLHPGREGFSNKVAVYLDGAEYHASKKNNRFAEDLLKREHLRKLGYLVWTMTWDDVAGAPEEQGCKALPGMNPWRQFLDLITKGSKTLRPEWHDEACQCALTQCGAEPQLRLLPELLEFRGYLETGSPDAPAWSDADETATNAVYAAVQDARPWRHVAHIVDPEADEPALLCRISFDSSLADDTSEYREEWHAFWMKYNLFQFLDDFHATTPLLGSETGYRYESAAKPCMPDWLQGASPELLDFFAALPDLPEGELYEDMADGNGQVIGLAWTIWKDRRVAIVPAEEAPALSALEKQGWNILVWDEENTAGLTDRVRTIFNL